MPTVTSVPGVYIEEDASPRISVNQRATAIPLFVGRFSPLEPVLTGVITRIDSWLDYSTLFNSSLSSSARISVTSTPISPSTKEEQPETESSKAASKSLAAKESKKYTYRIDETEVLEPIASVALSLYFQNGGGSCYIYPLENADDNTKLSVLPSQIDEVEDITLLACPDSDDAYRNAVYDALVASLGQHKGYFLLADSHDGLVPKGVSNAAQVAVYYPSFVRPYTRKIDDTQVVIDGYLDDSDKAIATLAALRLVNADFAGEIDKALADKLATPLLIPPSSLMAGVYAKTDRERGVWKAPANVVLNGVSEVSIRVTDEQQADLNPKGINVIRHFSDRGLVVWGSRTQQDDDDWRYISVRRLFDAAERDIKKALQPMVFEPNSQPTWKRVQTAIENYLYRLWQQGALAGNKAEEAYFVHVDKGLTMTQDDINQGKMIIQVGMAAVRPAEFIILKFTQDMSQ
ncbi:phage tail sheath family protein [Serratia marcescens]|uniref:phage tail sheath family protein n=1 Tax=Serratia marcescens TaxID=615 RepID=UPI000CA177F9|nr:phage tail sheath subtilisin-like domain-containing protein [Serratia marcescens]AUO01783.1 phage tail sheath family protein [Serratia marcescens]